MKTSLINKILEFSAFMKAIEYKRGVLVIMSAPPSVLLVESLKLIIKDVQMVDLILPVLAIIICSALYFFISMADLLTGLKASAKEKTNSDYVESYKLYNSIGKLGGVLFVNVLLLFLIVFLIIINFKTISLVFLMLTVLINVLAISFEIHSIGENIKRSTGNKPKFYTLWERIADALEVIFFEKLKKLFQ